MFFLIMSGLRKGTLPQLFGFLDNNPKRIVPCVSGGFLFFCWNRAVRERTQTERFVFFLL